MEEQKLENRIYPSRPRHAKNYRVFLQCIYSMAILENPCHVIMKYVLAEPPCNPNLDGAWHEEVGEGCSVEGNAVQHGKAVCQLFFFVTDTRCIHTYGRRELEEPHRGEGKRRLAAKRLLQHFFPTMANISSSLFFRMKVR